METVEILNYFLSRMENVSGKRMWEVREYRITEQLQVSDWSLRE